MRLVRTLCGLRLRRVLRLWFKENDTFKCTSEGAAALDKGDKIAAAKAEWITAYFASKKTAC